MGISGEMLIINSGLQTVVDLSGCNIKFSLKYFAIYSHYLDYVTLTLQRSREQQNILQLSQAADELASLGL